MKMTSQQLAWKIRRHGIEMTHLSGGSHIGAVMSVADIIGVLYAEILNILTTVNPDLAIHNKRIDILEPIPVELTLKEKIMMFLKK